MHAAMQITKGIKEWRGNFGSPKFVLPNFGNVLRSHLASSVNGADRYLVVRGN